MMRATKHPTVLAIFGATGNLAETKIFPALFALFMRKNIEDAFHVVAFARKLFDDHKYRENVRIWVERKVPRADPALLDSFLSRIHYVKGDFDDDTSYETLQKKLIALDNQVFGACSNKLFYLAVPPSLYENALSRLALSGLTIPCIGEDGGWTRILIEKPFGNDLETARNLDRLLGRLFKEDQIFRIDHYFAKETVQNILAFRFANGLFEPLWNKDHIAAVDIVMSEENTVGNRGALYDSLGALKDVGQNHVLIMLALIALMRPKEFKSDSIREARTRILESLVIPKPDNLARGQYIGYRAEKDVDKQSETETFFAIKTFIDMPHWKGVPFYLGSGKGFKSSEVEITVYFKRPTMVSFGGEACEKENALRFHIQPKEGIEVSFLAKIPGFGYDLREQHLSFFYDSPSGEKGDVPSAYERVLFDCILGDQTLFSSTREIEASWSFIASILDMWKGNPLKTYSIGTDMKMFAREILGEGFGDPLSKN